MSVGAGSDAQFDRAAARWFGFSATYRFQLRPGISADGNRCSRDLRKAVDSFSADAEFPSVLPFGSSPFSRWCGLPRAWHDRYFARFVTTRPIRDLIYRSSKDSKLRFVSDAKRKSNFGFSVKARSRSRFAASLRPISSAIIPA